MKLLSIFINIRDGRHDASSHYFCMGTVKKIQYSQDVIRDQALKQFDVIAHVQCTPIVRTPNVTFHIIIVIRNIVYQHVRKCK